MAAEPVNCVLEGCANRANLSRPICRTHWRRLPEDIRQRLIWAADEQDEMDWQAAVYAAQEFLDE